MPTHKIADKQSLARTPGSRLRCVSCWRVSGTREVLPSTASQPCAKQQGLDWSLCGA